jgi:diguanylate cyclase (GGDEF)-like protein
VPIFGPDEELFGTLCGYSPQSEPALTDDLETTGGTAGSELSALLHADLALTHAARDVERARSLADTDELTGLLNRRGWTRLLDLEEARYQRFGDPAGVVIIDLDNLKGINDMQGHHEGDQVLRETALVLRNSTSATDIVARLGGDEFGILAVGATNDHTATLIRRLRQAFDEAHLKVSIGHAPHTLTGGLQHAWRNADHQMYLNKQQRRAPPG